MHAKHWTGLLLLVVLTACGGATDPEVIATEVPAASEHATLDVSLPTVSADAQAAAATWKHFLTTPHYLGRLAVRFTDGAQVTYTNGQWVHRDGTPVAGLEQFATQFPTVRVNRFLADRTDDELLTARKQALAAGRFRHDWTQVFELTTPDAATAHAVLAFLYDHPLVEWAHPEARGRGANIILPNISAGPGQNYLTATNGGLNIVAGWEAGLTGAGQRFHDHEFDWNYSHVDVHVPPENISPSPSEPVTADMTNHGTAVLGLLAGLDNGTGITGIAPDGIVDTWRNCAGCSLALGLESMLDPPSWGAPIEPRGAILVIEQQAPGPKTPAQLPVTPDISGTNCPGCLPVEAYRLEFEAIKDLVSAGAIVIEAGGNGAINLDDPSNQAVMCAKGCPDLTTEDSGALLVAASEGPNYVRLSASNCGQRMNAFAWGKGVVTAGYGDHPMSVAGDPNQAYTQQFGGTSAATAILGGVAALLQEYAQQQYGQTVTVAATKGIVPVQDWQMVYFTSQHMRTLIEKAGQPQGDAGCHIGYQPDVGTALIVIKNGLVQPIIEPYAAYCAYSVSPMCQQTCETDPLNPKAQCGQQCMYDPTGRGCAEWCAANDGGPAELCGAITTQPAKASDVDGDGKADLIAYGRDGTWYIDRSSVNTTKSNDGFGAWDLVLAGDAPTPGERVFPVVADYNTDGQVDLATYNSDTGDWRVMWSRPLWKKPVAILGDVSWDHSVNFAQTNPAMWQKGSRVFATDVDEVQEVIGPNTSGHYVVTKTVEVVLLTPDGHWLASSHAQAHKWVAKYWNGTGPQYMTVGIASSPANSSALFSQGVLNEAPMKLTDAPAWAYLPFLTGDHGRDEELTGIAVKRPDGLAQENLLGAAEGVGNIPAAATSGLTPYDLAGTSDTFGDSNASRYVALASDTPAAIAPDGSWSAWVTYSGTSLSLSGVATGFGGIACHPIVADFDGDNVADRATLCPNGEWRIAYSSAPDVLRTIKLLGSPEEALPARVAPGGVAYQDIIATFAPVHFGCTGATATQCTIFDLPAPTGPYFASCMAQQPKNPLACLSE